jgi:4-hydroxybenzoate polyprenyltransferase
MLAHRRLALYLDLIRWKMPEGWYLLMWPGLSALWLAAGGFPGWRLMFVFAFGAFLMHAAGCCVNDVTDFKFDRHVKRTVGRVVASGSISRKEALLAGAAIALTAFALALTLGQHAVMWSLACLGITLFYPFTKRFFALPQMVLGMAYSGAIIMAFAAVRDHVPPIAWLLWLGNIFWVMAFDTEYAMQDIQDDLKIGMKTTAITLGNNLIAGIIGFYIAYIAIWTLALSLCGIHPIFYIAPVLALIQTWWFWTQFRTRDEAKCFNAFLKNHWMGATFFFGIVAALLVA